METHPEEVEEVTAELKDKPHLLQSLAKKVERETGRGELKVFFFSLQHRISCWDSAACDVTLSVFSPKQSWSHLYSSVL